MEHRDVGWGGINVSPQIARALSDVGYETPSPIQLATVPPLLEGRDLVGQAVTGSGKTAAFGIPLCELISDEAPGIQAIVLVPTRELAMQVTGEITRLGQHRGIRVVAVYGGEPIQKQLVALERGAHVVVGTPGRVMDHMQRSSLRLRTVRYAVLDEADEMLDIGFADAMEYILRHTPRSRQTALFSATIPGFVRRLIRKYLNEPEWVQLGQQIQTVDEVDQVYYEVAERDKWIGMKEIMRELPADAQALVFRRTQIGVDRLVSQMKREGHAVRGLHGGMAQSERNSVMRQFREGVLSMLVSTNLAARGIDISTITHVINYDMPDNVEEYVHRIGRTARMGRRGTAISFVAEWDTPVFEQVIGHVGATRIHRRELSIYGPAIATVG